MAPLNPAASNGLGGLLYLFIARGWREEKQKVVGAKLPQAGGKPPAQRQENFQDTRSTSMTHEWKSLTDEQLQKLATDFKAELAARERQRKKEALKRIKAMADAAGLNVSVTDKAKKRRGRPPKNDGQ
jgi:hypothetical protein